MRSAYRILALLLVLGVVLQAAFIAYAWFAVLGDLDTGAVYAEETEGNAGHTLHGIVGLMVMPVLALALLVVSFFAKIPGGVRWAAILLGLVVLQVALAIVAFSVPAIGALHGVNAILLAAFGGKAMSVAGNVAPAERTRTGTAAPA